MTTLPKKSKEYRIKWLREQFERLKQGINLPKLKLASNELNKNLLKKRQVIIVKKWSELGNELWSELWNELWSELRSELGNELGYYYWIWEYYENIWPIFINEFYPKLKVLQKNKNKIEALKKIIEAGNCYLIMNKSKLWIIPFPEIKVNQNKKLHSGTDYALKFLDKKSYWLFGVKINEPLWQKIISKQITFQEILGLKNIEQRMVAMKQMGAKWLLKEANAKLIDKSKRGNELYLIDKVFSRPAYFLKYKDKSTDREYIKGINPTFAKTPQELTADNAQAWSFQWSLAEYLGLKRET